MMLMRFSRHTKTLPFIAILLVVLTACMSDQTVRKSRVATDATVGSADRRPSSAGQEGDGTSAFDSPYQDQDISTNALDDILEHGRAELRHLVDPFDGTYKTKITIPKNFTGHMYLSGLNITSLSDRLVYVRFNFGRDLEPITIQGTIARAEGITPQTDIEVIVLDIRDKPFEGIRLLYDLFDYNDYRDEDGEETEEVVSSVRDNNLFCRGLRLQHDPTFERTTNNTACDDEGEMCRYAYVKIIDNGLTKTSSGLALTPSEPQIDINGEGYTEDSTSNALKKCLPDNRNLANFNGVLGTNVLNPLGYGITVQLGGSDYLYKGSFRPLATSLWEISGAALLSDLSDGANKPSGIFQFADDIDNMGSAYGSFLFPRAGKMSLNSQVEYFGSTEPFVEYKATLGATGRELSSLVSSGDSNYMDGCNIRVTNYDSYTNEGISSCNVTGTIEILTIDSATDEETILNTSIDLKLQLVRSSVTNYQGKEVLYSSMKICTNSNSCGADECCFNKRCWSTELVSQCLEDATVVGNGGTGDPCVSDYECSSFCCNSSTGTCGVHVNTSENEVFCSKTPGQTCISREWCRRENIQQCFIVKTGISPQGVQECALRCYNVPTFGVCREGICIPPTAPAIPTFDPSNPDCSSAIDPPTDF